MFPAKRWRQAREVVRWQQQLSEEIVRYKNEIHALLVVLFPEFCQVFADSSSPTALTGLKAYPSAQAMREADPKVLSQLLRQRCPGRYGRRTAETLVRLARGSVSSGQATRDPAKEHADSL